MHEESVGDSPLDAAAADAGPAARRAFALLSDETRLGILLALWAAADPSEPDDALTFSALRTRVGTPDSGRFNYHLQKLVGHYIDAADDGYRLREAGQHLVRAVIAGAGFDPVTVPSTGLDLPCHHCTAGSVEVGYRDDAVHVTCTHCGIDTLRFDFYPAGLTDRTPLEILRASHVKTRSDLTMMRAGVCPACTGPVERTVRICETHDPDHDGVCPDCDARNAVTVHYECPVCKRWDVASAFPHVIDHPAVTAFYDAHGVDPRLLVPTVEDYPQHWALLVQIEETLVATDPVRLDVTFACEGDHRTLTLDGDLAVVAIDGVPRPS